MMPQPNKRPAPLPDDFSKVFGSKSNQTSASPEAATPTREIKMGPLCPYCKASIGDPYTLSSKLNHTEAAEVILIYCTRCGYTLGVLRNDSY